MTDADFDIGVGPFTRLCIVVQAVFIVARCTGMVDWPWAVVFAPLMVCATEDREIERRDKCHKKRDE